MMNAMVMELLPHGNCNSDMNDNNCNGSDDIMDTDHGDTNSDIL